MDTSTATGRLIFNMLAVLSEFEREMIIERTHAGLAAARARGRKGGRPQKDVADIERALKLYKSEEYSIADISAMTGVSRATLYRRVNFSVLVFVIVFCKSIFEFQSYPLHPCRQMNKSGD